MRLILHLVAEKIRGPFPKIYELVSNEVENVLICLEMMIFI